MPDIDKVNALSEEELWEQYGIVRTAADYFHYGQFRYTSLKDAVAQSERDKPHTPRDER